MGQLLILGIYRCYSAGALSGNSNVGSFFGISCNVDCDNCYSNTTLAGTGLVMGGNSWGSSKANVGTELKALTVNLGDKFKKDEKAINLGYPILSWEN